MAVTITTLINGATVGSTPAAASNGLATGLNSATRRYSMTAQLTNGARGGDRQKCVRIYHLSHPVSMLAAAAIANCKGAARCLEVIPSKDPGGINTVQTDVYLVHGLYHYIWVEEPKLDAAATLTLTLCELDN